MLQFNEDRLQISVRSACLLMAALTIARGSSFLFSKQLLSGMEPLNLLGLRFLLAFLVLFVLFSRKVCGVVRQNPGIITASLLLGGSYFLCMAAELIGLQYTTSSACSFLENTAIVMVPVLEAILLRRFPAPVILISTAASLAGIALIVFRGSGMGIGIGELLCLGAAFMYAVSIILTDRFSKKHEPMTLGILYVGFMGLMGLVCSFFTESPHLPQTGGQWVMLIAAAVLCTCFGFTMQPVAQKPISSETAGLICALNPLTTAVLGWMIFGENLGVSGVIGAVLILAGIMLPNLRIRRCLPERSC